MLIALTLQNNLVAETKNERQINPTSQLNVLANSVLSHVGQFDS